MTNGEVREWLQIISKDVRAAGDVPLVRLSKDGVTEDWCTLADELWLVSICLDVPEVDA